jgi:hypothetical protein
MRRFPAAAAALCLAATFALSGLGPATAAAHVPAAASTPNFAPSTRVFGPARVYSFSQGVSNPSAVLAGNSTRLSGTGAQLVLDFGKEVGGIVSLRFAGDSGPDQRLGLAFSESSLYVGPNSDLSSGDFSRPDGAIFATVSGAGTYTMPAANLRGGFRYLTLFLTSPGWIDLSQVSLDFTAAPDMPDPSAYPNYFSSSDELLNRIWYAGAYTVQMDTIKPSQGRVWPAPTTQWRNDALVGVGSSILTDGAKRDRTVWAGDMGIAVPTAYVSTNDMASTRNALTTLYQLQNTTTGELPYAGPQINFPGSDTYHLWALLGSASYFTYTGDRGWLDQIWAQYKKGLAFSIGKIGGDGLMSVNLNQDWARDGQGGKNIEANAILYRVLTTGARLATVEGDSSLAASWTTRAIAVKNGANAVLWDAASGLYRDNPTSTVHPQDGNSLAVWFGLTTSLAQSATVSQSLTSRWNAFGATTPEKGGNIGTFPGSMEVLAHFSANDDQTGLDLIRREWGYMLNSPLGTASTFWEGFKADGSFDYLGNYMSHAHGWATGPTSALTNFVLGLNSTDPTGSYVFTPHAGDLGYAEGRLTLPQGALTASWTHDANAHSFWEQLTAPAGTTGTVGVPTSGRAVIVTMDGTTVWNGTKPTAAGVTTDGSYVYISGVQPGSHTFSSQSADLPLPAGYAACGAETQQCSFTGTRSVAFGANGHFYYGTFTGGTPCTPEVLGDPIFGVVKNCSVSAGPPAFSPCSAENAVCSFTGTRTVAYGAEGRFQYRPATGSISCDNTAFSDPIYGVAKACYVGAA